MAYQNHKAYTEFTTEKKAKFLKKLAELPNVARASRLAGITRRTAYNHRERDSEFAKAWDDAIDEGIERLEEKAMQRAQSHSDTLLIFLLKAHRPEKYKERHDFTSGDKPIQAISVVEVVKDYNGVP